MDADITSFPSSVVLDGKLVPPPRVGLFDVQLCGSLGLDWLVPAVEAEDVVTKQELADCLDRGLVPMWTNKNGETGFLPYTPYQTGVIARLQRSGRYGHDELRHIITSWNEYLEAVVMSEPAYDDDEIPEDGYPLDSGNHYRLWSACRRIIRAAMTKAQKDGLTQLRAINDC